MQAHDRELLRVAVTAAKRGGNLVRSYWGELRSEDVSTKSSPRDLVTIADKRSEEIVISTIREAYPDHGIISEESHNTGPGPQEWQWAIDPIDGTTNFRHGYPFFCVSIGLLRNHHPYLGVVYDPVKDELFTAVVGEGAYLNGQPISVSGVTDISQSLLVTGFAYGHVSEQKHSLEIFEKYNFLTHGVRRDGSAALDLSYVAAGRLDGFWEFGLQIWDLAAGSLLVREAGGTVVDPAGGEFRPFSGNLLAGNQQLVSDLHKALTSGV